MLQSNVLCTQMKEAHIWSLVSGLPIQQIRYPHTESVKIYLHISYIATTAQLWNFSESTLLRCFLETLKTFSLSMYFEKCNSTCKNAHYTSHLEMLCGNFRTCVMQQSWYHNYPNVWIQGRPLTERQRPALWTAQIRRIPSTLKVICNQ